jgi:hypothetical protein
LPSALADGEQVSLNTGFSQNQKNIHHPYCFSQSCKELFKFTDSAKAFLSFKDCPSAKADGNS